MYNEGSLVCICIPTYNAVNTIRDTLDSVLAQTHSNLIVHISDNASTDETLKIVGSVSDQRIRIHRQESNIGAEANFSRCIQLAEGKYTAIFHADDIYEPDMVEKQVAFLEKYSDAGAVFTEASLIDEVGAKIGEIRLPKRVESANGLYDFATMFKAVMQYSNFFICPSFMVRTQIYKQEIKVWRGELFGSGADLDVWLRILQNHPIGHLPERLMRYRISNKQFSARVRLETERAIIFKIIDYYLEQDGVRGMLNSDDFFNYKSLERRDKLGRAVNLFLIDRPQEAKQLLNSTLTWDAFKASCQSRRGLLVLLGNVYLKSLIAMHLYRIGKKSLDYIKQVTNR
jgi:glycosyltransferase involved in cell wall biosynthesis